MNIGTTDRIELEKKRLLAFDDWVQGMNGNKMAGKYGVTRTSTYRWIKTFAMEGRAGCRRRKASGRPCRVARDVLVALLGPDGMSAKQATELIWRTLGVEYRPDHMWRTMQKLGIPTRAQKPQAQTAQADWVQATLPEAISSLKEGPL